MAGMSVVGVDSAGGVITGGGQFFVTVDGQPVTVVGDRVAGHGDSPHRNPSMASGTPWLTINGIPVCKQGDRASCGHGSTGRPWITVG